LADCRGVDVAALARAEDIGPKILVTGASLVFALFLQPLDGALSDKIGRGTVLTWFGVTGTLCTIPLLHALQASRSPLTAFLLIAGAWLIVAGYTSINAVVKAELFPRRQRSIEGTQSGKQQTPGRPGSMGRGLGA
jgi:MFS family permease